MIRELKSRLNTRKLAPLKPAPIISRQPATDSQVHNRSPLRIAVTMNAIEATASARPRAACTASQTGAEVTAQATLRGASAKKFPVFDPGWPAGTVTYRLVTMPKKNCTSSSTHRVIACTVSRKFPVGRAMSGTDETRVIGTLRWADCGKIETCRNALSVRPGSGHDDA